MFQTNLFSFSRRFFYNTTKEIVEQHGKPFFVFKHRLEVLAYLLYIVRFSYILLSMCDPVHFHPLQKDFFTHFFDYLSTDQDLLFGGTFLMLFISCVIIERSIYFSRVDTPTWQIIYDGVVSSGRAFRKSRLSLAVRRSCFNRRQEKVKRKLSFLPNLLKNILSKLIAKAVMWYRCEGYSLEKVKSHRFAYIPLASVKLRAKMFVFVEMSEVVNWLIIVFISKKLSFKKVKNFKLNEFLFFRHISCTSLCILFRPFHQSRKTTAAIVLCALDTQHCWPFCLSLSGASHAQNLPLHCDAFQLYRHTLWGPL